MIETPTELSLDDPNGPNASAYTNAINFRIHVIVKQQIGSYPNPNFQIRSVLRLAKDDLKRLFGATPANYSINGSCDGIMYRGAQINQGNQNDVTKPATMATDWLVRYWQDRTNPLQYAGA
jgi:hypothetical protein